jgi:hypothetical protein
VTFQARDVAESRYIYDQMAVLGPIMLALTAGTPILQGRLVVRVPVCAACLFLALVADVSQSSRRWRVLCYTCCVHPFWGLEQKRHNRIPYHGMATNAPKNTKNKQDTDVRWDTIAGSVDDRTPAERGELGEDPRWVVFVCGVSLVCVSLAV